MFVRRQVAETPHVHQIHEVQRQGQSPVPMDISALIAAIASLRGGAHEAEHEVPTGDLDQILAALEGKGKGKGKGRKEDRECYNCGKEVHLARECRSERQPKGGGKDSKSKGKDKDRSFNHLADNEAEEQDDAGISIVYIACAPAEAQLTACARQAADTWRGYERIEALTGSGAGECVCGPQHFEGVSTKADPCRTAASPTRRRRRSTA